MKRKILSFIIFAIASIFILTSCAGLFGDDDGTDDKTDPKSYNKIVFADKNFDFTSVRTGVVNIVGPGVTLNLYTNTDEMSGELVFGDTNRAVTAAAKAELEAKLASSQKNDCGYIIYSDGKSIAVYWNHKDMIDIAVQKFVDIVIEDKRLSVDAGTIYVEEYVKREYDVNKHWIALEATADASVVAAIRTLYNYFDGTKMVGWMANLFDPEIGGFYYSNSARDNTGFLPDIESTSQILGTLVSMGAISNRNTGIPNEIKAKIVAFAQSLQSPDDGYFYHPQWPQGRENLNTDRYGRDLGNSTNTITGFSVDTDGDGEAEKQYPLYCAPNGVKCAIHTGTNEKCSFPKSASYYSDKFGSSVTTTLTSNVTSATAKLLAESVVHATVSSHPDYSSRTAFANWLEAYNERILENSGNAHNLSALLSEITQKGYSDIVLAHLDKYLEISFNEQLKYTNEPTGLWQSEINYRIVWSLLKYATFYNNGKNGKAFPYEYVPYMVKSCIKVTALEPDGGYYMNDLYNQWTSIQSLINNVNNYFEDAYGADKKQEALNQIYSIVRENAASLISNSLKKIEPFKMQDGSFAYQSNGKSMTTIYGTPIAMGVTEGDVNAVALVVGMYNAIFTCLNLKKVPLCTSEDGEFFVSEILACEPIDKGVASSGTHDFENGKPSSLTINLKTPEAQCDIVIDPVDSSNKVLMVKAGTDQSAGDYVNFRTTSRGSNCYIFETDIYVSSESDNGYLYQISMGNRYIFTLNKSGNTITVKDIPSTSHNSGQKVIGTFAADEWHRIRFEFYVYNENTNNLASPMTKFWIDEVLVTVSDMYVGIDTGKTPTSNYQLVQMYAMKVPRSIVYFDNCFFSTADKEYDPYDDTISDYRDDM